jgi:hypothetical protein
MYWARAVGCMLLDWCAGLVGCAAPVGWRDLQGLVSGLRYHCVILLPITNYSIKGLGLLGLTTLQLQMKRLAGLHVACTLELTGLRVL